ncbi:TNT domain-containing protein [Curtobacterium sp. Leaf261]|uniref:TNT domain-containing protein n=1 Tax=Curtobacterium sp. Leaf261 TaxID=1736311 RepID=UPI0006F52ED7|nr:TNT domain-containing protein [Curtobacterium sp. Leaf261]KQO62211.1 hypothetical protein ASF23_10340 [Curtobacterium sp. Leaf261]
MQFAAARETLDGLGFTTQFVILPGEVPDRPPLEGVLRLSAGDGRFLLECVDYGQPRTLATLTDEHQAVERVMTYLEQPLPAPRVVNRAELDQLSTASRESTPVLRTQVAGAPGGELLVDVPVGTALDRIGGPDGWMVNPLGASFESRALPPFALQEPSTVHQFIVSESVLMRVQVVRPWFGQPGGTLRFVIADDGIGLRDLVSSGVLTQLVLGV